jgi:hypothetical protein
LSRYGKPSRRMLRFLDNNPGSTAREISEHLHNNRTITQVKVSYDVKTYQGLEESYTPRWQSKDYVVNHMMNSSRFFNVRILDEREKSVSKICRGKFAYLTTPYHSRTMAGDPRGHTTHPGAANDDGQRRWFYRTKNKNNVFVYFLTLKGMQALKEHGLK